MNYVQVSVELHLMKMNLKAAKVALDTLTLQVARLEQQLADETKPVLALVPVSPVKTEPAPEPPVEVQVETKPVKVEVKPLDEPLIINDEWKRVLDILDNGSDHVFITGDAGTGKSTLLEYYQKNTKRTVAVVAPTGVAALRVRGETAHRFFRFGAHALEPDDITRVSDDTRRKKYECLQDLIVDEISMVRADMMDAIEKFLRLNGPKPGRPFGGVRLIMIGDLYQLPPVSKEKGERKYLEDRYGTPEPFFFHAECWRENPPKVCELTTIFRQKDPAFTTALNAIRRGNVTPEHLALINTRVNQRFAPTGDDLWLTLTTTNASAEQSNIKMLSGLPGPARWFDAIVDGEFDLRNAPTHEHLELKPGTVVMFIRNSPGRWVNGTMGKVVSVNPLMVDIKGLEYEVEPEIWEQIVYEYDEETRKLSRKTKGTFSQIPLKVAAAITVHKCLAWDTKVYTADNGLVPIFQVRPGMRVYTNDGSVQRVTLSSFIGERRTLTIRTAGRREIRCTPEHKLYCDGEWIEAQSLRVGDLLTTSSFEPHESYVTDLPPVVPTARGKVIDVPSQMTTDLAWWLGVMVGDGSYSDTTEGEFWLTTSSADVKHRFVAITQSFGIKVGERGKSDKNCFDLWFNSVPLRNWLVRLGLSYHRANVKSVPWIIFSCNAIERAAFLEGLFDSDGCVNKQGHIVFSTTSQSLVNGTQLLLDSLGIEARKAKPQQAAVVVGGEKYPTGSDALQLRICGHAEPKFIDLVGFTRSDRMDRWMNKGWSQEKCRHSSLKPNTDAIVEIVKNDGLEDVYDLEVENNHNFYANGVLVSNSQGISLDKGIIDLSSGAFASGQTYVALSRFRSLDGIVLRRAVRDSDLITNREVIRFMKGEPIARPKPRGQLSLLDAEPIPMNGTSNGMA